MSRSGWQNFDNYALFACEKDMRGTHMIKLNPYDLIKPIVTKWIQINPKGSNTFVFMQDGTMQGMNQGQQYDSGAQFNQQFSQQDYSMQQNLSPFGAPQQPQMQYNQQFPQQMQQSPFSMPQQQQQGGYNPLQQQQQQQQQNKYNPQQFSGSQQFPAQSFSQQSFMKQPAATGSRFIPSGPPPGMRSIANGPFGSQQQQGGYNQQPQQPQQQSQQPFQNNTIGFNDPQGKTMQQKSEGVKKFGVGMPGISAEVGFKNDFKKQNSSGFQCAPRTQGGFSPSGMPRGFGSSVNSLNEFQNKPFGQNAGTNPVASQFQHTPQNGFNAPPKGFSQPSGINPVLSMGRDQSPFSHGEFSSQSGGQQSGFGQSTGGFSPFAAQPRQQNQGQNQGQSQNKEVDDVFVMPVSTGYPGESLEQKEERLTKFIGELNDLHQKMMDTIKESSSKLNTLDADSRLKEIGKLKQRMDNVSKVKDEIGRIVKERDSVSEEVKRLKKEEEEKKEQAKKSEDELKKLIADEERSQARLAQDDYMKQFMAAKQQEQEQQQQQQERQQEQQQEQEQQQSEGTVIIGGEQIILADLIARSQAFQDPNTMVEYYEDPISGLCFIVNDDGSIETFSF